MAVPIGDERRFVCDMLPLDDRVICALRSICIINGPIFQRVYVKDVANAVLEQRGVADQVLRRCAVRLRERYDLWMDTLRGPPQGTTCRIRSIMRRASRVSMELRYNYIGTEHVLLACLGIMPALLGAYFEDMQPVFKEELRSFLGQDRMGRRQGKPMGSLDWPKWAPLCFIRVEDFPPGMEDDARLITDTLRICSKKELLQEPAIRHALLQHPKDVSELRAAVIEYWINEKGAL